MRVAIEGFYGHGNLGDEAILQALVAALRERAPIRPLVFTMRPEEVRREHRLDALHSRRASIVRRAGAILGARLFLLGGGGLLKDYGDDHRSLEGWLANLRLARRLRRPTALACVGVEGIRFDQSRRLLRECLQGVDDLTVRDRRSSEVLAELGVKGDIHVAADLALLLGGGDVAPRQVAADQPRVMVALRHWYAKGHFVEDETAFARALEAIAATADRLVRNRGATLLFVPLRTTEGDDDVEVARRVVARMCHGEGARLVRRVPSVHELIRMLDECDLVVGMRLHSLILAAARGVPMVGLGYLPKVAGFMCDLGEQRYCAKMESLTHEELGMLVDETLGCYASRSASILEAVAEQRGRLEAALNRWLALAG